MKELIDKIKQKGYWKIIIRPTNYDDNLISSLDECEKLITESQVSLRGWNYPHIDPQGFVRPCENSTSSYCNWPEGPMYEYWRFYKTGQFVHIFALREDLRIDEKKIKEFQSEYSTQATKYLSILSTLYSITEIFEFASRLFSKLDKAKGAEIIIELHDVQGRVLMFWDTFARTLYKAYTCNYENNIIKKEIKLSREDLIKNSSKISLDIAIDIFSSFGMVAKKEIFGEDQKKLLERRL